jgi:hypothetical protein
MKRLLNVATLFSAAIMSVALLATPSRVHAQDEAAMPDTVNADDARYKNGIAGEFTPGKGFDIFKTKRGSMNLSVYGLFRFLDQMPGKQTFTDHLGRERNVALRNDINWHRTFLWVSGFFYNPKFRYTVSVWSLPTTEQTLVFGLMRYCHSQAINFGAGVGPSLTARSMQGSWPFWAGSDRQMAEEFYRGGFASSFFVTGEPMKRFFYTAAVNRSLSQLGITAANDNRGYAFSASIWTLPTTGEFGPRGGFGDLEDHQSLATRFGLSVCNARESRYAPVGQPPRHGQLKLSDGVNPFDDGALADSVTVTDLTYEEIAFDAGAKYKGLSFQFEYAARRLSDFIATGPLTDASIVDHGFYAELGQMIVPRKLMLYACTGYVADEFKRHPWEVAGGASFYPYGSRSLRLNLHLIHIEKSPTGSSFGYYTAGQTGTTLSMGVDFLL